MHVIYCDICESTISMSEGKGYLNQQTADIVAAYNQEIYDMCVCCVNALQTEIKNVIEDWKSSKGTFQK